MNKRGPRYIARLRGAKAVPYTRRQEWAVFDSEIWGWPARLKGQEIPEAFPTKEEAQEWADMLNGGVLS